MILICSAWKEEIKALSQKDLGKDVLIQELGIGYLDAALNLQKLIIDQEAKGNPIERVVFLGTCGAYKGTEIGDLLEIESTSLLNLASKLGHSYVPENFKNESIKLEALSQDKSISDLKKAHCFSSLEITKDEAAVNKILELDLVEAGSYVENMELYGVAKLAQKHKIPCQAILGVTNLINQKAHDDWLSNHEQISQNLCEKVLSMTQLALLL